MELLVRSPVANGLPLNYIG